MYIFGKYFLLNILGLKLKIQNFMYFILKKRG